MIGPLDIRRASRLWRCGWLVAWTRLRYQRKFWEEHDHPRPECAPVSRKDHEVQAPRRRA